MANNRQSSKPVVPDPAEMEMSGVSETVSSNGTSPTTTDLIDLDVIRRSHATNALQSVKTHLTTIPVYKPKNSWWVRCHPAAQYRIIVTLLETEERELYLVHPHVEEELSRESFLSSRLLVTTVNKRGHLFLWPLRLPDEFGSTNHWNSSAMAAMTLAQTQWVCLKADRPAGLYQVKSPPDWGFLHDPSVRCTKQMK